MRQAGAGCWTGSGYYCRYYQTGFVERSARRPKAGRVEEGLSGRREAGEERAAFEAHGMDVQEDEGC
jgi:hypothetical protein